jgi:hypothetical protein
MKLHEIFKLSQASEKMKPAKKQRLEVKIEMLEE